MYILLRVVQEHFILLKFSSGFVAHCARWKNREQGCKHIYMNSPFVKLPIYMYIYILYAQYILWRYIKRIYSSILVQNFWFCLQRRNTYTLMYGTLEMSLFTCQQVLQISIQYGHNDNMLDLLFLGCFYLYIYPIRVWQIWILY